MNAPSWQVHIMITHQKQEGQTVHEDVPPGGQGLSPGGVAVPKLSWRSAQKEEDGHCKTEANLKTYRKKLVYSKISSTQSKAST